MQTLREKGLANGKLDRFAKTARSLAERLDAIFNSEDSHEYFEIMDVVPNRGRGLETVNFRSATFAGEKASARIDEIRIAIHALSDLAEMAETERERLPPMRSDARPPWQTGFVESLGYTWVELTGKNPSLAANSPFAKFVRAAYEVLGGDSEKISDHTIHDVVEDVRGQGQRAGRDENDQFDRYLRQSAAVLGKLEEMGEDAWRAERQACRDSRKLLRLFPAL